MTTFKIPFTDDFFRSTRNHFFAKTRPLTESHMAAIKSERERTLADFSKQMRDSVTKELIREQRWLSDPTFKHYFREIEFDIEILLYDGVFLVASEFRGLSSLAYLSALDLAKNPGIYILFNDSEIYVGQSAVEILARLKAHSKDEKKEGVLKNGRIIFFGQRDARLGKDQLDFIEKRLIAYFSETGREKINETSGNSSYISTEHAMIASHLIAQAFYLLQALPPSLNPLFEPEISITHTRSIPTRTLGGYLAEQLKATQRNRERILENFRIPQEIKKILEEIRKIAEKQKPKLKVIEYEWPLETKRIVAPPKTLGKFDEFYDPARDGEWPMKDHEARLKESELLAQQESQHDGVPE